MVSLEAFRTLALDLPETQESTHFSMVVFGVGKKRFAALDPKTGQLSIKLPLNDPDRLKGLSEGLLAPASGKYGEQGWTTIDMDRIDVPEFVVLLTGAHRSVLPAPKIPKAQKTV
ncbi:MAG: MmcQ/YjbR family DNA-binding protein [Fibrobacteria bacterium]|nr:MmcQ/YjbR family DNA-binding protein [Fibrobacteria bacterium]